MLCAFWVGVTHAQESWEVNASLYEYSMTVTAVIQVADTLAEHTPELKLGAFNPEGICVGVGNARYYASVEKYRIPLIIYGDTNGEELDLRAYFMGQDIEINLQNDFAFVPNSSLGNFVNPQVLMAIEFPVSVEDQPADKDFKLYPNPAVEQITVTAINKGIISFWNLEGRLVLQQNITDKNTHIEVSELPRGNYILQFTSDQSRVTRKILLE